jgi:succinate dehydrogenase hydrophobic anchor subunit
MYLVLGGLVMGGDFVWDVTWDYVTTEMTRTTIPVVIGAVMGFVVAVTVKRGLDERLGPAQEDDS